MNGAKKIFTRRRRGAKFFCIAFCFIGILFFSCSKKEEKIPAGIISKEKMVQLLVDYHLAESQAQLNALADDTRPLRQAFYKYLFTKHQTNYQQLKKSFDFYSSRPEIFSKIYDEVIIELSKKQAETVKE